MSQASHNRRHQIDAASGGRTGGVEAVGISVRPAVFVFAVLALGTILVVSAVELGPAHLPDRPGYGDPNTGFLRRVSRSDAVWYEQIARYGYSYHPDRRSALAFFPMYPILGRAVATCGVSTTVSLLFVSHASRLVALVLLFVYARDHRAGLHRRYAALTLTAAGLFPTSFFQHLPYSEATFLLLVLLTFLGIRRRWALVGIAALIGLATATRPVGVALIPPFLVHLWARHPAPGAFLCRVIVLAPICLSGLLLYAAYQWVAFDEPFAFVQTQTHWRMVPVVPASYRFTSLLALEPLWGYLDPASPFHWQRLPPRELTVLSAPVIDRLAWLFAVGMTAVGWWNRWLTAEELLLVVGLIGIPYVFRGYEMAFFSQGRFTSVAFPIFLVSARLLTAVPMWLAVGLLATSGLLMTTCAAMFAAGYAFI